MGGNNGSLQPLDAVVSGYAFENATAAISVLEEGKAAKRWMSTEMFCALENFIGVVLFNERVFLTGCADLKDNRFVPRNPEYAGGPAGRRLFEKAKIFLPISEIKGDANAVADRVAKVLHPVRMDETPLFIIRCGMPKKQRTIFQEMVYLDAFFIEYAIEQFGAERFKAVFPGEHLYLGLRQKRLPVPQATHTMADLPGRRLRDVVRGKMEKLNAFVSQGAPLLPELPPIFASRILHDCAQGSDFVSVLLDVRGKLARLREWLARCSKLSQSADLAQRAKAAEALGKLEAFSPDEDLTATQFGIGLLKILKDVVTADPVGIIEQIGPPVMTYLGGVSLSGLRQFGSKNADPAAVERFLKDNFGDKFNRNEMDFISNLLGLPGDLGEWEKAEAEFASDGGRLEGQAPPLSRPCFIQTASPAYVGNAQADFEELLKNAVPVTPELLRQMGASKKRSE